MEYVRVCCGYLCRCRWPMGANVLCSVPGGRHTLWLPTKPPVPVFRRQLAMWCLWCHCAHKERAAYCFCYSHLFRKVQSSIFTFDDANIRIHSRIAHSFYEYHLESYTKHAKKKCVQRYRKNSNNSDNEMKELTMLKMWKYAFINLKVSHQPKGERFLTILLFWTYFDRISLSLSSWSVCCFHAAAPFSVVDSLMLLVNKH